MSPTEEHAAPGPDEVASAAQDARQHGDARQHEDATAHQQTTQASGPGSSLGDQETAQALGAAEQGLQDVQAMLRGAARGTVPPDQLRASLQGYLETHGPALQASAAAVGEDVRQQALAQLYAWRDQLRTQRSERAGQQRPGESQPTDEQASGSP
jgi:hypothetical protein